MTMFMSSRRIMGGKGRTERERWMERIEEREGQRGRDGGRGGGGGGEGEMGGGERGEGGREGGRDGGGREKYNQLAILDQVVGLAVICSLHDRP